MKQVYICGTSGNGKSELVRKMAPHLTKSYPDIDPSDAGLWQANRMLLKLNELTCGDEPVNDRSVFDHLAWAVVDKRSIMRDVTEFFVRLIDATQINYSDKMFILAPNNPYFVIDRPEVKREYAAAAGVTVNDLTPEMVIEFQREWYTVMRNLLTMYATNFFMCYPGDTQGSYFDWQLEAERTAIRFLAKEDQYDR